MNAINREELTKRLIELEHKVKFIMKTFSLSKQVQTPAGVAHVKLTLGEMYEETMHGVTKPLETDPEPTRAHPEGIAGLESDVDEPPDPAEEAAAAERLTALRQELRAGR